MLLTCFVHPEVDVDVIPNQDKLSQCSHGSRESNIHVRTLNKSCKSVHQTDRVCDGIQVLVSPRWTVREQVGNNDPLNLK